MTKQVFSNDDFCGSWVNRRDWPGCARQANGAVVVRYGESTVLTAAVMSKKMATGDFFPLQDYEEKCMQLEISGGFMKAWRSSLFNRYDLIARLIDRPIRPMFAEGFRNEVQVINTVLSLRWNASAPMAAMAGSSWHFLSQIFHLTDQSLEVQVGYVDGRSSSTQRKEQAECFLPWIDSCWYQTRYQHGRVWCQELSEEIMLEALLRQGHEAVKELTPSRRNRSSSWEKKKQR